MSDAVEELILKAMGLQNQLYRIGNELTALRKENADLRAMLEEVQWADNSQDEFSAQCMICGGTGPKGEPLGYTGRPGTGHRKGCRLAALLEEGKP